MFGWPPRWRLAAAGAILACCATAGCATYSDRLAAAMQSGAVGDYASAVASIDSALDVPSPDALPADWKGDSALAVLERSIFLQAAENFADSSRGLSAAEQELELLDLKSDPIGEIGSYVYSDSARTYKTPPSERLAVNAINLLNYLARGDLDGAAGEARRFQVMREYLASLEIEADGPATIGTYLAGFVFEKRGEGERALRYYDEALAKGALESLREPVHRLARTNEYRGCNLDAFLATPAPELPLDADGEILVVVNAGRVPHKIPERIPVGAAIGIAGSVLTGDIDPLRYGVGKVVVYPAMVSTPSSLGSASVAIDGEQVAVERLVDFGAAIEREYEEAKPRIVAAALTRMAVRAAAAEGVRQAGKQESNVLGDVISIAAEAVLVALDRPDTRSWMTLPDQVLVARIPVPAGEHEVEVGFSGDPSALRHFRVQVGVGGYAAVVVTEPR